jgi:hypothetical protein
LELGVFQFQDFAGTLMQAFYVPVHTLKLVFQYKADFFGKGRSFDGNIRFFFLYARGDISLQGMARICKGFTRLRE